MTGERVIIRFKGSCLKSADEKYTPTISIPLKATLAYALQIMGVQRDKIEEVLAEAMTLAIISCEKGAEFIDAAFETSQQRARNERRVQALVESLPKDTRDGKLTIKGLEYDIEVLDPKQQEEGIPATVISGKK